VNAHLEQTVGAMGDAGVDVLLLGRDANARFVSGADRLFVSGSRAFAPGCVVVRETAAVHLLTISDDGVPADVPHDRFFPISWNPVNLLGAITAMPGVANARRIGVDGLTPLFMQLAQGFLPNAELVDGESLMRDVRRVKSLDDIDAIRGAVAVLGDALGAATAALVPGVREAELKGIFEDQMAEHGDRSPAFEASFCVATKGQPPRAFVSDRVVATGDVVHIRAGVLHDGWEGAVARTHACGAERPAAPAAHTETIAAARSGATVGVLRATGAIVDGVGIGHEELADHDALEPGMVLWIERWSDPVLVGDTVLVTENEPEVLTSVA
jgi:Xaa-Pro aminopeptidase